MKHLHYHQGFNLSQHFWHDFGNLTTLSVFTATIISFVYSLYLWYSLKSLPIINSHSNIETIYQRLLLIIKNHIYKIFAGNLCGVIIVMIILLSYVEKFRSGYLSFAYILGSLIVSLIALWSSRVLAETAVKVVYESEKYTLNQKDKRLNVVKKGASLVGCFTISLVLLVMFVLHLSYNHLVHFLVRRQVLECMLSFAFGGISTSLFLNSIGGILSKGLDIGSDTYGKIVCNLQEDHARNLGSLYDAAGDILGKGIGAVCRRAAEFMTVIAVVMIIAHFSTKSIDGTSITQQFISIPYLVGAIAVITQVIISVIVNNSLSSSIGIKGIQLGAAIIFLLFVLFSIYKKVYFITEGYYTHGSDFIKVLLSLGSGLLLGTLIAFQSQLFISPQCRFFNQVYQSTTTGASTNLIQGLATGYLVTLLPTLLIAAILFINYYYLNAFGIALTALGMGSTIPIVLNIVNINIILDSALCLSKLTTLNNQAIFLRPDFQESRFEQYYVRMFTISLNTLSSVAFFLFLLYTLPSLSSNYAVEFGGLLVGSMFPYIILSLHLRACASIATQFVSLLKFLRSYEDQSIYLLSIWETMLFTLCCLLIIITPILTLQLFGIVVLKGFIAGCLISVLQISISSLGAGSILATVNERIEREHLLRSLRTNSEEQIMWKGGIVGDNVGDSLKDLGEPVINLLGSSVVIVSVLAALPYYLFPL